MIHLDSLTSPILFRGNETLAYRDPAVIYDSGTFHLFFTLVQTEEDGRVFLFVATSKSVDLVTWTAPRILTPKDRGLNYSSPGNIIRFAGRWILCLQTYPRPDGEKYGNAQARLFTMSSTDLETWSAPRLLRVKGPEVPEAAMGRMIDPFLVEDKDQPGKWWCFYKQDGVSISSSFDLEEWSYFGNVKAGENACVITDRDEYVLFHSPDNGIGVKRSRDLKHWRDEGIFFLGQKDWPWAAGRLTAGFVLDLRREPDIGKALLFFHGSGPEDERTLFDTHASIGVAWSDSLEGWCWPGKLRLE
ncbi:hypothetical protein DB345_09415 [Spartobacteria bacterium LR76]|nr:hypothetical protein DB345_09415 [Spartobacteria bacterium LR76]